MAIVKMNKFTLLAFESKKEELLEKLQTFSEVEFINLQNEDVQAKNELLSELDKDGIDSDISRWEEELSKAKFALQFLQNYVPKQSLMKSLRQEKLSLTAKELEKKVLNGNWESVYDKVKEKEHALAMLDNEKTKLQGNVQTLKPYEGFNAPLGSLDELKETVHFLGSIANQYEEALQNDLDDCYLEIISKDNQDTYFLLLTNKDKKEEVEEVLRGFGFSPFKTEEKELPLKLIQDYNERISLIESEKFLVKEELSGYEENLESLKLAYEYYYNLVNRKLVSSHFLKTDKTVLLQGWVPISQNEKLTNIVKEVLEDSYYLNLEEVKEEEIDDVPIKLENNDLNSAFESVTSMYALPKYNDIDPTPFVTPFYLVFFGMMVADAGYGLLMLLASFGALKLFNFKDETKRMVKFFMYLSFPTMLFGGLYGSFFGDLLPIKGLIDTGKDVMTILAMSVVFGAIQIVFGLFVKAAVLIRAGKKADAFMDVGSWLITLFSIGGIAAGSMLNIPVLKTMSIAGAIIGSLLIILTQGRQMESTGGKVGQGLYELYGITGYISDLVSYTRLMAIGLSGGSIAGAINLIMKMVTDNGNSLLGTLLVGPLIFIIFQTVNLLLSLLSGYVHTLRLTYVEYFSKFYDGGGRAFEPFETKNEYINLRRE
ncbi:V-type ATP synthase subunit I [Clostridium weizhouense]|uniref:V-type ATP synthase subunit I n=1 Tax=Clostridium weizhouense TaxID=2859781 RepID=A0ABS7AKI9_9CLOT|nr:V-type ATP synthase subunit I [Clostridium weizhouense]MBW6409147.1 V-type ATP synthase subunit I [Clostridium weizhouense]